MVAVHRIADHRVVVLNAPGADAGADRSTRRVVSARPTLRLIEGGVPARSVTTSPATVIAVVAVMLTLSLVFLVRGVQGAPPASDWNGLTAVAGAPAPGIAGSAEVTTYTVGADDTWASISADIAPGADPVDVARQLASVNGGYALRPGQVLTIPLNR